MLHLQSFWERGVGGRRRALSFLSTHASCPSPSFSRSLTAFLSPEHSGYWRPSKGLRGCKRERHRWGAGDNPPLEKKHSLPRNIIITTWRYQPSCLTPSARSPQHPFMHPDRPALGLYRMHSPVPYKTRCGRDHCGKCSQHYAFNCTAHSLATSLPLSCPPALVVCETTFTTSCADESLSGLALAAYRCRAPSLMGFSCPHEWLNAGLGIMSIQVSARTDCVKPAASAANLQLGH